MALLPDLIRIGPAAVSAAWVAVLICFLLGSTLLKKALQARSLDGEKQVGWLFEAAFLGFLIYRVVTVGFDWTDLLHNPRNLLLSVGPSYAMWSAMAGGVLYVLWRVYRMGELSWRWGEAWIVPIGLTVVLYSLLIADVGRVSHLPWGASFDGVLYHPLNVYRAFGWGIATWGLSLLQGGPKLKLAMALVAWMAAELWVASFDFSSLV